MEHRRMASSRDRVRQYRQRLRQQGLRSIQIWVPDVNAPEFVREAHRQSALVAASDQDADDQAFVDAVSPNGTTTPNVRRGDIYTAATRGQKPLAHNRQAWPVVLLNGQRIEGSAAERRQQSVQRSVPNRRPTITHDGPQTNAILSPAVSMLTKGKCTAV
jgi:Protein  of unknown function (DUF3018)